MPGSLDRFKPFWRLTSLLLLVATHTFAAPDYRTDIAPILRDYCAGCHNDDDLEGDLSVETFAQLLKGGEHGEPITPGNANESLLFQMLTGQGKKKKMPPRREPQPTTEQVERIRSWIDAGASGPAAGADPSLLATLLLPDGPYAARQTPSVTAAEFSPDGSQLAIARYRQVEIIDPKTGKTLHTLAGHPGKINAVHFSDDLIVTASGIAGLRGDAFLWKGETLVKSFSDQHRDLLYDAELSPDGTLLATAGYDRKIVIWETGSGEVARTIDGHNGAVFDLAFSPDGTILASASADETVKLWKVSDGERLDTLNQPQAEQYAVVFTPDGERLAAAGADNRIRLWQLVSKTQPAINPLLHARFAHEDAIVGLAVSPDGTSLVSSSADRSIKLWKLPDLTLSQTWSDRGDITAALAMHPGGDRLAALDLKGDREWLTLKPGLEKATTTPGNPDLLPHPHNSGQHSHEMAESEPNDTARQAQAVDLPARIKGDISRPGDADLFRFSARAGEEWSLEVNAARSKSKLDSRIEVLDAGGRPVERVVLQAVRDSWFRFRGKNSNTSGDFRLQNWREMELNEYLYANGEVVKLWLYPQGPDSGFKVYPGYGNRHTYFGTTALAHPLGEPCYIVQPVPPGTEPAPNGLPLFTLHYANDDDPQRRWGADSLLIFTAPVDGDYLARLTDVRGDGGDSFAYTLMIRPRQPGFKVTLDLNKQPISPGSGREFTVRVERQDEFDGPIRIDVANVPEGFIVPSPIVIQAGQDRAIGLVYAATNAVSPESPSDGNVRLTASAIVNRKEVTQEIGSLGDLKLGPPAKLLVEIQPDGPGDAVTNSNGLLEFVIAPGETITARVKATRIDFNSRIELGGDDSGRNLPHGVYVDNIGLNGLLIVEDQTERQFFITAADWVPETSRYFHLRATGDGGQASMPALLHVRRPRASAALESP